MQKYLIDTQILIWYQLDSSKLSPKIYKQLTDMANTIVVSQVSLFEIAIKQKIGKLPKLTIPIDTLVKTIKEDDFSILGIKDEHIASYQHIPLFDNHRDPFDRLILATAYFEKMPIISSDEKFLLYRDIVPLIENHA